LAMVERFIVHMATCRDCRPWRFEVLTRLIPALAVCGLLMWWWL